MRILLKFVIDCDAAAAWRAVHSPQALAEVYGPLVRMNPATPPPTSYEAGSELAVRMSLFGIIPLGEHLIRIAERHLTEPGGSVRIVRDRGVPITGPLALVRTWDQQMAVSPAPEDPTRTLWRERVVLTGAAAPLLWPALWALWQWRAQRIRTLARTWAHDVEQP